jgi:hypothetical protein
MGGDVDAPHGQRLACADDAAFGDLLRDIVGSGYPPGIADGPASGSARSGAPLAVMAQGGGMAMLPAAARGTRRLDVRHLHFSYHAQVPTDTVRTVPERLTLHART